MEKNFRNICRKTLSHKRYLAFLAHIGYREFEAGGCIVSPPDAVCVTTNYTTLCRILVTTLLTFTSIHYESQNGIFMACSIFNKLLQKNSTRD